MKPKTTVASKLYEYAHEVLESWTAGGVMTKTGRDYRDFLLRCAERVLASSGEYIDWAMYEQICAGDEFDLSLRAWEESEDLFGPRAAPSCRLPLRGEPRREENG